MNQKWLMSIVITIVILCIVQFGTYGQAPDFVIYYQSEAGLTRFLYPNQESEIVTTEIPFGRIQFSNSNEQVAFRTDAGFWISDLTNWSPKLVIEDTRQGGFGWFWTFDDTRLIVKLSSQVSQPNDMPNDIITLAYDTEKNEVDPWHYGNCTSIAKGNNNTLRLICFPDPWMETTEPKAIALEWGGDYAEYIEDTYEVLLSDARLSILFDWRIVGENEALAYWSHSLEAGESDRMVMIQDGDEIAFPLRNNPSNVQHVKISPNGRYISYTANCNSQILQNCLQIIDTNSGEVLLENTNQPFADLVQNLVWTPDSSYLVMLEQTNSADFYLNITSLANLDIERISIAPISGDIAIARSS